MAEKGEEVLVKKNSQNKRQGKLDFETLYDQIMQKNRVLKKNKSFWTRKGNSQKYTCTLCNIGIQVSTNLQAFKSAILAHVEDKYHKKRYDSFVATESAIDGSVEIPPINKKIEGRQSVDTIEDDLSVLDILQQDEDVLMSGMQEPDNSKRNVNNNCLVDFNLIYNSFEKSNPVVKTSKPFIVKAENGRDFYCTLCKVLVFNSLSATELRYSLFVHLNEEGHRERLPNFTEIEKDFQKVMLNLSKALPASYKNEIKCFEVGPVFRYVKCSLCDLAVSTNLHRLENHLKGKYHLENKQNAMKGELLQTEPLNNRTRNAFRKLVVQLDDQFKKDVKYIHIGKIPGYVVCSLCSYVVLPTKFYVETHLEAAVHAKNKTTNAVNRNSKFKIALKDLMKTLPDDFKDFNIFQETAFGLTCKRCDTTIPPTSYDLYTHINKERLACVS